jgi:hypothetical protein
VLTIDPDHLMPEIEISAVAVPCSDVGVHRRLPLALLNDHHCVGNERIAADMVEVKMRIDDDVDPRRIAVDRFEPRTDFLARTVVEREEIGEPLAEAPGRVVLAVRMHSGVEQRRALGMLDQIGWDRQLRLALPALHQAAEIPGQMAASQGEELYAQFSLLNENLKELLLLLVIPAQAGTPGFQPLALGPRFRGADDSGWMARFFTACFAGVTITFMPRGSDRRLPGQI